MSVLAVWFALVLFLEVACRIFEEVTSLVESWELSQVSPCHVVNSTRKWRRAGFQETKLRSVYKIMDVSILKLCW